MEAVVYNIKGEDTGRKVVLNDKVFGLDLNEGNAKHTVYLSVKQYLGNQRQGTHKSKERSEVSGSTRKLGRRKGGGGARRGDINSPLLRGGGTVFGPRPRDYRSKLNKKMKALARKDRPHFQGCGRPDLRSGELHFRCPEDQELYGHRQGFQP